MNSCFQCGKQINGEHLLVEMPGKGELPVHEDCYNTCLPVCAWCRVELEDAYVLYNGEKYGVVSLHEGCRAAFVEANKATKGPDSIQSITKPSENKKAGKGNDRLFIDDMSLGELRLEINRRGLTIPEIHLKSQQDLAKVLRENWDEKVG
eukprot:TRINITY_DN29145_c0_g1_i1.p1 TRINITY_DN29145_c0_g1~~TRINITY_DN29145_c0_g1_i1.p1  ORF type:complete len:150 (+),score=23.24 TRINITY_DN29145_c0_g1_i1:42-491(+)